MSPPRSIAVLMRHGDYHQLPDTPSAQQPFALNANGRRQALEGADKLAAQLSARHWTLETVVDSSRLLRAWQTADLISTRLGADFEVAEFDALSERSVGIAGNLSIRQIEQLLRDDPRYSPPPQGWKADSRYCLPLPGAESLLQAGERAAAHINAALSRPTNPATVARVKLFVGHGAAFRHAAYHLGVLEFNQIATLSMYHAEPLLLERLPNGSWRHVAGTWKQRNSEAYTD